MQQAATLRLVSKQYEFSELSNAKNRLWHLWSKRDWFVDIENNRVVLEGPVLIHELAGLARAIQEVSKLQFCEFIISLHGRLPNVENPPAALTGSWLCPKRFYELGKPRDVWWELRLDQLTKLVEARFKNPEGIKNEEWSIAYELATALTIMLFSAETFFLMWHHTAADSAAKDYHLAAEAEKCALPEGAVPIQPGL